jgi:hypothetical protein
MKLLRVWLLLGGSDIGLMRPGLGFIGGALSKYTKPPVQTRSKLIIIL